MAEAASQFDEARRVCEDIGMHLNAEQINELLQRQGDDSLEKTAFYYLKTFGPDICGMR